MQQNTQSERSGSQQRTTKISDNTEAPQKCCLKDHPPCQKGKGFSKEEGKQTDHIVNRPDGVPTSTEDSDLNIQLGTNHAQQLDWESRTEHVRCLRQWTKSGELFDLDHQSQAQFINHKDEVCLKSQHKQIYQLMYLESEFILTEGCGFNEADEQRIRNEIPCLKSSKRVKGSMKQYETVSDSFMKNVIVICTEKDRANNCSISPTQTLLQLIQLPVVQFVYVQQTRNHDEIELNDKTVIRWKSIEDLINLMKMHTKNRGQGRFKDNLSYSLLNHEKTKPMTYWLNIHWTLGPQDRHSALKSFCTLAKFYGKSLPQFQSKGLSQQFREQFGIIRKYTAQEEQGIFYKLLNLGMRILSNPIHICHFLSPIGELYRAIRQLFFRQSEQQFRQEQFTVWRGCKLTAVESEQLRTNSAKGNCYIQTQGFISTSFDKGMVDIFFAKNTILRITVPVIEKCSEFHGFASISKYSKIQSQQQILFNPLSCFKVIGFHQKASSQLRFDQIDLEYVSFEEMVRKKGNKLGKTETNIVKYLNKLEKTSLSITNQGDLLEKHGLHYEYLIWLFCQFSQKIERTKELTHSSELLKEESVQQALTVIIQSLFEMVSSNYIDRMGALILKETNQALSGSSRDSSLFKIATCDFSNLIGSQRLALINLQLRALQFCFDGSIAQQSEKESYQRMKFALQVKLVEQYSRSGNKQELISLVHNIMSPIKTIPYLSRVWREDYDEEEHHIVKSYHTIMKELQKQQLFELASKLHKRIWEIVNYSQGKNDTLLEYQINHLHSEKTISQQKNENMIRTYRETVAKDQNQFGTINWEYMKKEMSSKKYIDCLQKQSRKYGINSEGDIIGLISVLDMLKPAYQQANQYKECIDTCQQLLQLIPKVGVLPAQSEIEFKISILECSIKMQTDGSDSEIKQLNDRSALEIEKLLITRPLSLPDRCYLAIIYIRKVMLKTRVDQITALVRKITGFESHEEDILYLNYHLLKSIDQIIEWINQCSLDESHAKKLQLDLITGFVNPEYSVDLLREVLKGIQDVNKEPLQHVVASIYYHLGIFIKELSQLFTYLQMALSIYQKHKLQEDDLFSEIQIQIFHYLLKTHDYRQLKTQYQQIANKSDVRVRYYRRLIQPLDYFHSGKYLECRQCLLKNLADLQTNDNFSKNWKQRLIKVNCSYLILTNEYLGNFQTQTNIIDQFLQQFPDSPQLLFYKASANYKAENFEQALKYSKKAEALIQNNPSSKQIELRVILMMSKIYCSKVETQNMGIRYLNKCQDIIKSKPKSTWDPSTIRSLTVNKINVLPLKSPLQRKRELQDLQQELKVSQQIYKQDPQCYLLILSIMASIYQLDNNEQKYRQFHEKTGQIMGSQKPSRDIQISHLFVSAQIYLKNKEYDKAISQYEQARSLIHPQQYSEHTYAIEKTFWIYNQKGEIKKADECLQEIKYICLKWHDQDSALKLGRTSYLFLRIGCREEATKCINECKRILKEHRSPSVQIFIASLMHCARSAIQMKKYGLAEQLTRKCEEAAIQNLGPNNIQLGQIYKQRGRCSFVNGLRNSGFNYLKMSYLINHQKLGAAHSDTKQGLSIVLFTMNSLKIKGQLEYKFDQFVNGLSTEQLQQVGEVVGESIGKIEESLIQQILAAICRAMERKE